MVLARVQETAKLKEKGTSGGSNSSGRTSSEIKYNWIWGKTYDLNANVTLTNPFVSDTPFIGSLLV